MSGVWKYTFYLRNKIRSSSSVKYFYVRHWELYFLKELKNWLYTSEKSCSSSENNVFFIEK